MLNKHFTAEDFREIFLKSVFDYLHENGINLYKIEEVFPRYEENHIAHSINMGLNMVMEQLVDSLLLNQNILTRNELGTELESDFRIEIHPETSKPTINSKYKLFYKVKNLDLTFECSLELDEFENTEALNQLIGKVTSEVGKQL